MNIVLPCEVTDIQIAKQYLTEKYPGTQIRTRKNQRFLKKLPFFLLEISNSMGNVTCTFYEKEI